MKRVFVLALFAFAWTARAQGIGQQSASNEPPPDPGLASSIRIDLELPSGSGRVPAAPSEVLTAEYRSRMLDEAGWLQSHYGLTPGNQTAARVSVHRFSRFPAGAGSVLVQELRLGAGRPLAGLRLEQHNVLLAGDELSLRSGSDVETLARWTGASLSETETSWLSVLGWRSRSELHWKAGDPARQWQWQVNAVLDRRAADHKGNIELRVLRRF
jgi:hypothetical protein